MDVNDTTADNAARMIPSTRPCPENNMIAALTCTTPMISHAQPQNWRLSYRSVPLGEILLLQDRREPLDGVERSRDAEHRAGEVVPSAIARSFCHGANPPRDT